LFSSTAVKKTATFLDRQDDTPARWKARTESREIRPVSKTYGSCGMSPHLMSYWSETR
jgi:hypothetical protein